MLAASDSHWPAAANGARVRVRMLNTSAAATADRKNDDHVNAVGRAREDSDRRGVAMALPFTKYGGRHTVRVTCHSM